MCRLSHNYKYLFFKNILFQKRFISEDILYQMSLILVYLFQFNEQTTIDMSVWEYLCTSVNCPSFHNTLNYEKNNNSRLTSLTGLYEEHLGLSFKTWTVCVWEEICNVQYSDRQTVTGEHMTQFAMGHNDTDKGVVTAVIDKVGCQQNLLKFCDVDISM